MVFKWRGNGTLFVVNSNEKKGRSLSAPACIVWVTDWMHVNMNILTFMCHIPSSHCVCAGLRCGRVTFTTCWCEIARRFHVRRHTLTRCLRSRTPFTIQSAVKKNHDQTKTALVPMYRMGRTHDRRSADLLHILAEKRQTRATPVCKQRKGTKSHIGANIGTLEAIRVVIKTAEMFVSIARSLTLLVLYCCCFFFFVVVLFVCVIFCSLQNSLSNRETTDDSPLLLLIFFFLFFFFFFIYLHRS